MDATTDTVSAAPVDTDNLYGPDSSGWSPALASVNFLDMLGLPGTDSGSPNPQSSTSDVPTAYVPRPPDPSVGGMHGLSRKFGWSTGLRPSRTLRQLFSGKTLIVPTMGVHPVEGPVGFSSWMDRRDLGVEALYNEWLPSQRQIQQSFTRGI